MGGGGKGHGRKGSEVRIGQSSGGDGKDTEESFN